ncbi:MAG: hypothetical protein IPI38_14175 [Gemmatimonadetes bacterium]|nr:hypothetical protein [Gemmatimonadota bacterium]
MIRELAGRVHHDPRHHALHGRGERCGRVALLWRGKLVTVGAPHEITVQLGQPTLEDAFIALQERDGATA